MGVHLALIVGGAAAVEVAVALGGLEGRSGPKLQGVGGLHIVMAVAEDGRFARSVQPIGIYQGVSAGLNEFDILHAGSAESGGDEFGGAFDVGAILGQSADARNPQKLFQLLKEPGFRCWFTKASVAVDMVSPGDGANHYTAVIERGWRMEREQALNRIRRTSGS